jgi:CHASE3 domain sensor protein
MKELVTWQDRVGDIVRYILICVVAFDTFLVYTSYKATQAVTRNMQNNVIEEQVFSDLKDAECGQRGFLYTDGNEDYLPQYYVGVASTKADMLILKQYSAQDPDSGYVIRQLEKEVNNKLQELDSTVRAYRGGDHAKAKAIVMSGTGMEDMERVRTLIGVLRAQQRDRLRQHRIFF